MHEQFLVAEAATSRDSGLWWPSQLPGTFVLATAVLFGNPPASAQASQDQPASAQEEASATASSFQSTHIAAGGTEDQELFAALSQAYERIAATQTDLGPEIRRILYANLQSLYE